MKEKAFKEIIVLALIIGCIALVYTNLKLQRENSTLKQNYEILNERLKEVEKEWESVKKVNEKLTVIAPKLNEISKTKLSYYIHYYSKKYKEKQYMKDIIISLPHVESSFRKYVIGLAGEIGYYQIHPIHITESDWKTGNVYEEEFQVRNAYKILNTKFEVFKTVQYAINGYNGWASHKNPYYNKVLVPLKKIQNI